MRLGGVRGAIINDSGLKKLPEGYQKRREKGLRVLEKKRTEGSEERILWSLEYAERVTIGLERGMGLTRTRENGRTIARRERSGESAHE